MALALYSDRLSRAQSALPQQNADWLLIPASADFRWLTGSVARSTERLVLLALPQNGEAFCIVPRLEADALSQHCAWLPLEVWEESENPLERLSRRIGLERRPKLLVGEGFRSAVLLELAGAASCRPAASILAPLRAIKDREEIAALERASANADRVVEEIADRLRPGMSERQIARQVLERFETLGDSDPWAIVASGPNSALPHHHSSDRRVLENDVVLIDAGAFTDGYASDITRTYWLGTPPPEASRVYEIVDAARSAGVAASHTGQPCEAVDRAARGLIAEAGFGDYFIHRTGHGVGLEIHELPYLVAGNREPLAAGMVHSVEPGIYLPGRFGVRLEDLVVVEDGKSRVLNRAPRDPLPPCLRS